MRWAYVERPFREMATAYLEKLRDPPIYRNPVFLRKPILDRRATVFALAHACWRKGELDLAQQIFDEAKKIPTERTPGNEEVDVPMRESLELEFGHTAMWDALLRVGKLRWDEWHNGQEMVPRTELLKLFQDIIRKYPASPQAERAKQTAAMLERMVEEDAAHPHFSENQIAALPVEEQVREWIFRLRDQSGEQLGEPGGCSVFGFDFDGGTSPAHRLAQIGYPAVPHLIEALSDDRLSRAVQCSRSFFFSHEILTIGDCAKQILYEITGESFDPPRARAWWEQFQQKGEKQMLIDAISSGAENPYPIVSKLKSKWPEAVEPALLVGADKAQAEMKPVFIRTLANLDSPAATERLRRFMREDPGLWNRVAAARALVDRNDPEAAPAMLAEWTHFSQEPLDPFGNEVPNKFEALTGCLIASGNVAAIQALRKKWDGLDALKREVIVHGLGGGTWGFEDIRKPLPPDAQAEAIALLVHALDEFTQLDGQSGWAGDTTPRICDRAAWALHRIDPETYSRSEKAGRRQRDLERIIMLNTWRKAHHLALLPVPAAPAKLEPEEALQITHFADLSPEVTAGKELKEKVIALGGTDFQGNTLPYLIQWIAITADPEIQSVQIDVRRDNDLRGVEVEMRMEAGASARVPSPFDWRIQLQGTVGERQFYLNPRASSKAPREDRYWREFIEEANEALRIPPETELLIHAEIDTPRSVSF
jgi:hypothetical protein